MDVGFGVLGRLVLDNVRKLGDIDAARGDVGRNEELQVPSRTRESTFSRALWFRSALNSSAS
jgi:hypothetical protein